MKKRIFALLLALSLLLCACGGGTTDAPTIAATDAAATAETSGGEATDTEAAAFTTRSVAAAETYHISEQISDNLTVDADVINYPADGQAAVYSAEPMDFSEEEIQAFVEACGNSILSTTTSDDGDMQYYKGQCEGGYSFVYMKGLEGKNNHPYRQLNYNNSTRYQRYHTYPIFQNEYQYYTNAKNEVAWMFTEEKELSFGTAADAEAQVREALSCLGLSELTLLRTLYIDSETLTKAGELVMTDEAFAPISNSPVANNGYEAIEWTEDDDAYMFSFAISVESTSVSCIIDEDETATYTACDIVVWYTRDGIACLTVCTPWEITGEAEAPAAVVSPETALGVATEKYSYMLNYQDVQIEEVRFEYRYMQVRDSWQLKPVYTIRVSFMKNIGSSTRYYEYMLVDALTGEEV